MMNSPYETNALNKLNTGNTEKLLKSYYITGRLKQFQLTQDQYDNFIVLGLVDNVDDVPVFYQPMTLVIPDKKTAIVVDLRPYLKSVGMDSSGELIQYTANESITQLLVQATLIGQWREDPVRLVNINDIPLKVYGTLFSDALAKRLGLDPVVQLNVMATMQIFYITRAHRNVEAISDEEKTTLSMMLARKNSVDMNTHKSVFEKMTGEDLVDLVSVVKFIKDQNWSPRLNGITARDVYTLLLNLWVGQGNPKETAMVALEFPPTFLSLCYMTARSSYYQKFPIGVIMKRLDRSGALKSFEVNIRTLTRLEL